MGFRFRKSVKICKGVKVNFSKSGASLSLGGRGYRGRIPHQGFADHREHDEEDGR